MTDRIDQEGRASFVKTLPRKVTELRATLGTLVADPKSQRMRDELRRRLHALYTLTRSYNLPTLSDGLREGIAHLDAVRGASILTQRDLETLADLIATLPALAQRDVPDAPVEPTPAIPLDVVPLPPLPESAKRASVRPAARPSSIPPPYPGTPRTETPAATGTSPRLANQTAPLGVLVVGGAGLHQEVKRLLPPEADLVSVRTLADAITAARDTAPDVIVAECAPPADGLGLIASLRGDPLTDFLPVILLAGPNDRVDPASLETLGGAEVLSVPVDPKQLREAIEKGAQGLTPGRSVPPPAFGDVTLEELTRTLQEEIRKGILTAAGPKATGAKVALGQGSEVLAAAWEAIARVREVVEKRTRGRVRFDLPGSALGITDAHLLAIGGDDDALADDGGGDDPLPGRKVLVVDDDPGVVWFFAGLLREAGMDVVECTDGAAALREARKHRPDTIITDILMPGMDGFALCRAIRRDVSLRHTPVILLSWKEDLLVRMRELGAQAQGFLRKESRGEAILARVRSVLRPRVRILRRIESLEPNAELRGRVERVGVFALLDTTARALGNATLTITDSFSITELELRDHNLAAAVRTLQDGTLVRGESALLQVLGTNAARFAIKPSDHPVRPNIQGELTKLLAGGASLITALEDSLSGAALLEVANVDVDADQALAYARSLPEVLRSAIERIVKGESPRNLVLRDGIAPGELEPILVELARRGAVRSVRGANGEDLVAPRYAAQQMGDSLRPGEGTKVSTTLPAVLEIPQAPLLPRIDTVAMPPAPESEAESLTRAIVEDHLRESQRPPPDVMTSESDAPISEPPAAPIELRRHPSRPAMPALSIPEAKTPDSKPEPVKAEAKAEPAPETKSETTPETKPETKADAKGESKPFWTPPSNADEAAKPGFGVENEKDSLARAVLRELSEPNIQLGDEPEISDDGDGETALSQDEIRKAAATTPGVPLEGVALDARGLPRRRASAPDLPEIDGEAFAPHEPAKKDTSPSSSIIVDEREVGGKVEIAERRAAKASRMRDTEPPPRRRSESDGTGASGIVWMLLAMGVLAAASYLGVSYWLRRSGSQSTTEHEAAVVRPSPNTVRPVDAAHAPLTPVADANGTSVSPSPDAATVGEAPSGSPDASMVEAPTAGSVVDAGQVYEDPARYLDGGTLPEGRGLLVVDTPARDAEITVDSHVAGHGPLSIPLPAGTHTVRFRSNAVAVYRFVVIEPGRAVRVVLSTEQ